MTATPKKRITVQSGKAKGRNLQIKVRDIIYKFFPMLEEGDVKSTSMGAGGEDLQLSPAARKRFPFQIECKSRASFAFYKDLEQCIKHGKHEPILVYKADRKDPYVVVKLDTFMDLAQHKYGEPDESGT